MRTELRIAPSLAGTWLAVGLQYGRFLIVGAIATLVHVLLYVAAVAELGWSPLAANALGFAVGVQVSFFGHGRWTFRGATGSPSRFLVVAALGFAINSLCVQLVTTGLGLSYGWAIPFIAGVTPVLSFSLNKLWAFRS
ncbi:MAG: GtrA family protein [Geminicoccaceae bacterium]